MKIEGLELTEEDEEEILKVLNGEMTSKAYVEEIKKRYAKL